MLRLDDPRTMAELEDAMSRLKARKAGGFSGIRPELVLCGSPVLLDITCSDASCLKGWMCV